MGKKTIFILAILAILMSAIIKFYIRNMVVEAAQELMDFLSGFLLGAGVSIPLVMAFKKKNM